MRGVFCVDTFMSVPDYIRLDKKYFNNYNKIVKILTYYTMLRILNNFIINFYFFK